MSPELRHDAGLCFHHCLVNLYQVRKERLSNINIRPFVIPPQWSSFFSLESLLSLSFAESKSLGDSVSEDMAN